MGVTNEYLNEICDHMITKITHIDLMNSSTAQIERKAATFERTTDGVIRPDADITFDVSAGSTVASWKAFHVNGESTVDYGGNTLVNEIYAGAGEYKLLKDDTGMKHEVAST